MVAKKKKKVSEPFSLPSVSSHAPTPHLLGTFHAGQPGTSTSSNPALWSGPLGNLVEVIPSSLFSSLTLNVMHTCASVSLPRSLHNILEPACALARCSTVTHVCMWHPCSF